MNKQTPAEIPVVEEKRDARPWLPEERQKFYECFAKHYKKFNIISEMVAIYHFQLIWIDPNTIVHAGSAILLSGN